MNKSYKINKCIALSSLSVNDKFRFTDYRDIPVGPVYCVTGREYDLVTYVNSLDLFSPVYYAIHYAYVLPYK